MAPKAAIFSLFLIFLFAQISSAEKVWQAQNTGISDIDIRSISVFPGDDNFICAASAKIVYSSQDSGSSWSEIFSLEPEAEEINFIIFDCVDPKILYLATTKGLFATKNRGQDWRRIFRSLRDEARDIGWIALDSLERKKIYLGTAEGLYLSGDSGATWRKSGGGLPHCEVRSIVVHPANSQVLYLANSFGLFKSINAGRSWTRIYVTSHKVSDEEGTSEVNENQNLINCIAIDQHNPKKIFLATGKGISISADAGESWNGLVAQGLSNDYVNFIVISDKNSPLYAATKGGVFEFSPKSKTWQEIYQGMTARDVRSLALNKDGRQLFAGTDRGVFKTANAKYAQKQNSEHLLKELSLNEPTIQEVQQAALRYADVVHPERIKTLRRNAKLRALLPKLSVGADRNVTDLYHWEGGSTATVDDDFLRKGKDVIEWDASLTWDFGDLLFSEQVRLLDSNARLMVQLRDDILNEVTRLYYERRRLQTELILTPPASSEEALTKTLRLEELTANIDALTGGYFSRQLENK